MLGVLFQRFVFQTRLSMVDGRIWRYAKIPLYKHSTVALCATIVAVTSQILEEGFEKTSLVLDYNSGTITVIYNMDAKL